MKKTSIIILSIIVLSILTTAGILLFRAGQNSVDTTDYADSRFISQMKKNIIARDKISSKNGDSIENAQALVDSEKSILDFENANFNDMRLKKIAEDYISGLKMQSDAILYFSDPIAFNSKWTEGFNKRSVSIAQLIDEYNLKIPENAKKVFINNSNLVKLKETENTKVQDLCKSIQFEEVAANSGYFTYGATVENTTEYNFDLMTLKINLMKDDIIQDSVISTIRNWNSGKKAYFEFDTFKKFDCYEITGEYSLAQ